MYGNNLSKICCLKNKQRLIQNTLKTLKGKKGWKREALTKIVEQIQELTTNFKVGKYGFSSVKLTVEKKLEIPPLMFLKVGLTMVINTLL